MNAQKRCVHANTDYSCNDPQQEGKHTSSKLTFTRNTCATGSACLKSLYFSQSDLFDVGILYSACHGASECGEQSMFACVKRNVDQKRHKL